jgi:hypothetical protein
MLPVNITTFKNPGQRVSDSSINTLLSIVGLSLGPELIGDHVAYFLDVDQALLERVDCSAAVGLDSDVHLWL